MTSLSMKCCTITCVLTIEKTSSVDQSGAYKSLLCLRRLRCLGISLSWEGFMLLDPAPYWDSMPELGFAQVGNLTQWQKQETEILDTLVTAIEASVKARKEQLHENKSMDPKASCLWHSLGNAPPNLKLERMLGASINKPGCQLPDLPIVYLPTFLPMPYPC